MPTTARGRTFVRGPAAAWGRSRRGDGLALGGLVTALVIGILGMHALTSHGAAPVPSAPGLTAAAGHHGNASQAHPRVELDAPLSAGSPHATRDHTPTVMGTANGTSMADDDSAAENQAAGPAHKQGEERSHGSGHGLGGMAMLCIAMLAAAALTLLAQPATGVFPWMRLSELERLTTRVRTLTWVRSNGPPPAWEFSVIRC